MALAGTVSAAHGQLLSEYTIHPPAPRPFEHVALRPKGLVCVNIGSRVERVGTEFVVTFFPTWDYVSCLPIVGSFYRPEIGLGSFPPGTYKVKVVNEGALQIATSRQLEFTVDARPDPPFTSRPLTDYSGHWWDPDESGWGLAIHQSATDQMMVVWYVYDAQGDPIWYVAPGGTWKGRYGNPFWEGTVYRTKVPPSLPAFDPSSVERTAVGKVGLEFLGAEWALLEYEIDGNSFIEQIRKMQF